MSGPLNVLKNTQIIILGVCIAFATIISALIISKGMVEFKKFSEQVIEVTGSAEKRITSDYIVWECHFSRCAPVLKDAYAMLEEDLKKVKNYLLAQGIKESEIYIYPVSTKIMYKKTEKGYDTNEVENYCVSQRIKVESHDVPKVDSVARCSTELIKQGIQFFSEPPKYFYTKLDTLKVEMLKEATANAKQRAVNIARSTGNTIGSIRSARMGVFQINPVTSTDVSWYGNNDTSSLEKKVMAVVKVKFSIK